MGEMPLHLDMFQNKVGQLEVKQDWPEVDGYRRWERAARISLHYFFYLCMYLNIVLNTNLKKERKITNIQCAGKGTDFHGFIFSCL